MTPMIPIVKGQLFMYFFINDDDIPATLFLAFTASTLLSLRRVFYFQYQSKLSLLCIFSSKQFTPISLNLRRFCDRMVSSAVGRSCRRYVLLRVYLMGFLIFDP
jgi:hypothetical protein